MAFWKLRSGCPQIAQNKFEDSLYIRYLENRRSSQPSRKKRWLFLVRKILSLPKVVASQHTSYSHIRQSLTLEYTKIYAFGLYTTAGTLSRSIVATDRQSSPFFVNVWMALKFSELCKIILTREKFSQDTKSSCTVLAIVVIERWMVPKTRVSLDSI